MTRHAANPTKPKRKKLEPMPCPFCGEKPRFVRWHNFGWQLGCDKGRHMASTMFLKTKPLTIEAWNTRAR